MTETQATEKSKVKASSYEEYLLPWRVLQGMGGGRFGNLVNDHKKEKLAELGYPMTLEQWEASDGSEGPLPFPADTTSSDQQAEGKAATYLDYLRPWIELAKGGRLEGLDEDQKKQKLHELGYRMTLEQWQASDGTEGPLPFPEE